MPKNYTVEVEREDSDGTLYLTQKQLKASRKITLGVRDLDEPGFAEPKQKRIKTFC